MFYITGGWGKGRQTGTTFNQWATLRHHISLMKWGTRIKEIKSGCGEGSLGVQWPYMIFPRVSYTCTPQYFSSPAKDHAEADLRSKKQGLVPTFQWRKLSTLINGIKRDPQFMRKPGELPPPGTVLHGVGPVSGILPKASQDVNQRKWWLTHPSPWNHSSMAVKSSSNQWEFMVFSSCQVVRPDPAPLHTLNTALTAYLDTALTARSLCALEAPTCHRKCFIPTADQDTKISCITFLTLSWKQPQKQRFPPVFPFTQKEKCS